MGPAGFKEGVPEKERFELDSERERVSMGREGSNEVISNQGAEFIPIKCAGSEMGLGSKQCKPSCCSQSSSCWACHPCLLCLHLHLQPVF